MDIPSLVSGIQTFLQNKLYSQPPAVSQPYLDPLVAKINEQRQANNLSPLSVNLKLNTSAVMKALDEAQYGYWAHTKPSGERSWDTIRNAGYQYSAAGENLARGFSDDDATMQAWMNSPTHKANILSPDFTEIGVGRHTDSNGREYVTLHFGKPQGE